MENIVINFAGDIFLAQAVKSYLSSKKLVSSIYMIPDSDEISVWFEKNNILDILRNYLDSHYLTRYQIMNLTIFLRWGFQRGLMKYQIFSCVRFVVGE
jgi:hypothetical protein